MTVLLEYLIKIMYCHELLIHVVSLMKVTRNSFDIIIIFERLELLPTDSGMYIIILA